MRLNIIKNHLRKFFINKEYFIFLFTTFLLVILFYFLFYYIPLQKNRELFPETKEKEVFLKEPINESALLLHGIYYKEIDDLENVYFIDGREEEEYNAIHIKGSIHLRVADILGKEDIINALNLNQEEFNNSLIVIYCHDGHRGSEIAEKINLANVKFLIGGRTNFLEIDEFLLEGDINKNPFPDDIKNYDFVVSHEDGFKIFKDKNATLIDGRLIGIDILLDVHKIRIGQMTTEEYEKKIEEIKEDNIFLIFTESYPDLFYAKLLIYRLERDHDLNYKNFYIIFTQTEEFIEKLNSYL